MVLGKYISSIIKDGKRLVKILCFGKTDVRDTISECAPFGVDSVAMPKMQAVYGDTMVNGRHVILGYINTHQLAAEGEARFYSINSDGSLSTYIWIKNNATIEIAGSDDNMVRYSKLQEAFNELKSEVDTFKDKWNAFCSAYVPGSPSTTGLPAALSGSTVPHSTADITHAKIDQVKTLSYTAP